MFARTFAISWLSYCGLYLCRKNFSVLMPYFKSEAGLSSLDLANALTAYSLAYAAGQFLMGRLADRIGARVIVTLGMLGSALTSALMTEWHWQSLAVALIALQLLNGIAQSTGWPGLLKLTRDWFPIGNRGVILGWWSTSLVVGGFAGTWLAASVAAARWTRAGWVPAVVLTLIAIAFAFIARDGETRTVTGAQPKGNLILSPPLLAISAMYFCVKLIRYVCLFWLPLYLTEHLGYGKPQAGYASSIYEVIGFLGVLGAGYVSERRAGSRFAVSSSMLVVLAVLCALYPAVSGAGLIPNLIAIALIGAFTFGPDTLMAAAALQDVVPAEHTGTAAGFVNGVGSAGQLVSPYIVAFLSSQFGWGSLFAFMAATAIAGALALATQMGRAEKVRPAAA